MWFETHEKCWYVPSKWQIFVFRFLLLQVHDIFPFFSFVNFTVAVLLFLSFFCGNWRSLVQRWSDGPIAVAPCVELHQLGCEGSSIDFPLRYLAQWDTNVIWALTQYLTASEGEKNPAWLLLPQLLGLVNVTYGEDWTSSALLCCALCHFWMTCTLPYFLIDLSYSLTISTKPLSFSLLKARELIQRSSKTCKLSILYCNFSHFLPAPLHTLMSPIHYCRPDCPEWPAPFFIV